MQQPPNPYSHFQPQQWQQPPMPPQQQWNPQQPPYQQQQYQPPLQQPYVLPGTVLCNREILGPYHAVELYQDGALWIIDQEDPPIEIKLDNQATQRLRDFLMRLDGQQCKAEYPYQQPINAAPAYTEPQSYQQIDPSSEDQKYQHYQNERATLWLFLIWPIGVYLMWKHASWSKTTKIMISALFAVLALLWLMYTHK